MKYKYNNEWKELNVKVSDTYPIGAIAPYGGATAPTNWLICDGSAVSRVTYADLFSVIGTSFGSGDGSTTFNLPDLRSRVPLGKDSRDTDFDTIGETYGEKNHTLTIDEMPSHSHSYMSSAGGGGWRNQISAGSNEDTSLQSTYSTGGGQAHNNVQPSLVTNYIIKAFQSAGVVGNVAKTYTESDDDTYNCNYINQAIEEIEDNILTPIDVTSQINFTNCTFNGGKVIKLGNFVFMQVKLTSTITDSWGALASDLPEDLLPMELQDSGCPISNSKFWVYGGNKKTINGEVTTGQVVFINGFWILND